MVLTGAAGRSRPSCRQSIPVPAQLPLVLCSLRGRRTPPWAARRRGRGRKRRGRRRRRRFISSTEERVFLVLQQRHVRHTAG
eukprot:383296-Hanusia_phi.AAC.1